MESCVEDGEGLLAQNLPLEVRLFLPYLELIHMGRPEVSILSRHARLRRRNFVSTAFWVGEGLGELFDVEVARDSVALC